MGKSYKIAVIPGDGTGPEVTVEAVKVLETAADKFGFKVNLTEYDFGGEQDPAVGGSSRGHSLGGFIVNRPACQDGHERYRKASPYNCQHENRRRSGT